MFTISPTKIYKEWQTIRKIEITAELEKEINKILVKLLIIKIKTIVDCDI